MQARQQTRENGDRIHHRTAVNPRMQIMGRTRQLHFQGRNPPEPVRQGRSIWTCHVRVGNNGHIALQVILPRAQNSLEIIAPHLFFSLHHKDHVGRRPTFPNRLGHAQHVSEDLSLVIGRTTRHHHPIQHPWLKGIPGPPISHLCRLHIVMTVNQNLSTFSRSSLAPLGQHHRSPGRRHNFRLQTHSHKLLLQPRGAVPHRLVACRIGRDCWKPQKVEIIGFYAFS